MADPPQTGNGLIIQQALGLDSAFPQTKVQEWSRLSLDEVSG